MVEQMEQIADLALRRPQLIEGLATRPAASQMLAHVLARRSPGFERRTQFAVTQMYGSDLVENGSDAYPPYA